MSDLNADDIDPNFLRVVGRLLVHEEEGARGTLAIGPYTAYSLIGVIQMCTRHPGLSGSMAQALIEVAEVLGRWLVEGFSEDDPDREILQNIITMGFDPANDR